MGEGGEEEAYVFNLIPLANQGVSQKGPCVWPHVQPVAIKRGWMRVANLKSRSARLNEEVKLVVNITVHSQSSCSFNTHTAKFTLPVPVSRSSFCKLISS